ncbi:MAG: MT-A70 family methyltransferase [Bradyrhizobium sp.]|nr:MT-A70 family methyltransferase [Bradyrhizobium sp.]
MSAPFFFHPLYPFCADLIVCDPPWTYDLRSSNGEAKSPQAHYKCMPNDKIGQLPVGQRAGRDAWLFLWATAPLLPRCLEVMSAWGFTYKTTLIWRKTTRSGKVRVGPGYLARTMHEQILVGSLGLPHYAHALPSIFDGLAREHSRKPEEFYERIERFAPQARKLDLFGRQSRPGWLVFGNEATKFDEPIPALEDEVIAHEPA